MVLSIPRFISVALIALALTPLSAFAEGLEQNAFSIPGYFFERSLSEWQPQKGDVFVADTQKNIGYLMHANGEYVGMTIGSGQRKVVRYIGRTYFAASPEGLFHVYKKERQYGDPVTFDKDGTFFRLITDRGERTAYGIHSTLYIDTVLSRDRDARYASMGCILTNRDVLKAIEKTVAVTGDMPVIITEGLQKWDSEFAKYIQDKNAILAVRGF
ncbi:MAG: L,D-transpeptidase [Candidatus Peribacteraceae bacterium]|nr:L,D-transpeptidase [Candidatus Peribacteraceae bacterium]